ncbi:MAG: hypothetical protein GX576_12915 [Thauera phenolivorans]|uniref:DUF3322 and DUF2220 domain-containing protein n=1 Tax=Thauera phenolivorans TaxID=1792543 RepID=A0A7X7R9C7_9RHOO|nr:hypothetical protein [Thauera phenolivorans]
MSWSTASDLRAQVMRLWERGELLREGLPQDSGEPPRACLPEEEGEGAQSGEQPSDAAADTTAGLPAGRSRFPLRLSLKTPTSDDITRRFDAVRAWVAAISATPHVRLEWQETRHRVQGSQRLPASAWVDRLDDALAWIGKRAEHARFRALNAETATRQPLLLPWLAKRPLRALELAADWSRLIDVVAWLQAHPRPGVYLRQVDLPGIHTKFIESQRGVLAELLDLALPAAAIDPARTGAQQFAARYGFLDKPALLRFRVLDPALGLLPGAPWPDLALDADSFARLRLDVARVFITENETNFLAFPRVDKAIVIFGAGYGWDALARAEWLQHCPIHYWGDIDTNGFAILAQLRARFAHVESLLMDRSTLHAHEALWGREDSQRPADVSRLSAEERSLYEDLRDHRIRPFLRLEQEHVGFGRLEKSLQIIQSVDDSQPLRG